IIILLLTINNKKQINKIINSLLFSSLIVSLYGILQWLGVDSFPWQKAVAVGGRVISTFGQPVFLGNYLLLVIFLTIYKFIITESFFKRFLFILLFVSQLLCLVFTYSRGSWIGFAFGLLVIIFIIFKNYHPKYKKVFVWFIILFLLLLFFLFLGKDNFFVDRIKSMADLGSGSIALRLKYWDAGLKAIAKQPLVGYGLENQQQVILKYYDPTWSIFETINTSPDRLHNELLDLCFQGGIFLVLSYLFILFYLFFKAINILPKLNKQDQWLLIILLTSIFSYQIALLSSFSTIDTSPIFWGYTALILIIINKASIEKNNDNLLDEQRKQRNLILIIFIILVILSLIFLIKKDIDKIKADYYFRLARISYAKEDYLKMIDNYLMVFNYNSEEKFYSWFFANDIEKALNNIDNQNFRKTVLVYIKNYLINNQSDIDNYAELIKRAKMFTLLGFYDNNDYFAKAEKIYDKLVLFNPLYFDTYSAWAKELIYSNNCKKALELYKKAIATLPALDDPKLNDEHRQELIKAVVDVYKNMAYCYKEISNGNDERAEYKKILKLDPYRFDIYDLLAQAYYRSGNIDKSIWLNQRGMMLDKKNYYWPMVLSSLYRDKKDLIKAKEYLDQAIKLAPENKELKKYEKEVNK
ncbi:MAG: O-antigen ligase family protein, partial [Patescibacteria group bacterium]